MKKYSHNKNNISDEKYKLNIKITRYIIQFKPIKEVGVSPRKCAVATLYKSAALATKRWKLEYYFEEAAGRLYDRINDPDEQVSFYGKPEYAEECNKLVKALLT